MSWQLMNWAYQVQLPPCPKAVLVALSNRANKEGYCWPGLEDLRLRTGWNKRSIQRALRRLEADKLISCSARFLSTGLQTSHLYRIAMTSIASGEGDTVSGERVAERQSGGDMVSRGRVTVCRGEGDSLSPKSSSEHLEEQSSESSVGAQVRPRSRLTEKSAETWEGYRKGYHTRYGVNPLRDARVDADLCKLVDRLGEEAASVAEFYVSLDRPLYVQAGHATNLLVRDYQALRTQWKTRPIRGPIAGPEVFHPSPTMEKLQTECPPEAAAVLSRILGRAAFGFPTDRKEGEGCSSSEVAMSGCSLPRARALCGAGATDSVHTIPRQFGGNEGDRNL